MGLAEVSFSVLALLILLVTIVVVLVAVTALLAVARVTLMWLAVDNALMPSLAVIAAADPMARALPLTALRSCPHVTHEKKSVCGDVSVLVSHTHESPTKQSTNNSDNLKQ